MVTVLNKHTCTVYLNVLLLFVYFCLALFFCCVVEKVKEDMENFWHQLLKLRKSELSLQ